MGAWSFGALALQGRALDVPERQPATAPAWGFRELAGRLVEVSAARAAAHLTTAFGLVLEAQLAGDRAAWVQLEGSTFFPPDAAEGGVDLDALPVVRAPDVRTAGRAADTLVRSGGFGLVVLDLSEAASHAAPLPVPLLTRLLGLARAEHAVVLILTRKPAEAASLDSLISLRAEAVSRSSPRGDGEYDVEIRVIKDKRHAAGWSHRETCRGPAGLR
jgi:recombination protein RecA